MKPSTDHLATLLSSKKIRPSYQRLRVLECLHEPDVHPTVEEIFHQLSPEIPSLSKATIYNTLHTFLKAGLVRAISIDEGELRYDFNVSEHGHFKCSSCGSIYNFAIDMEKIPVSGLDGFQVSDRNIYFTGTCPDCLSQPTTPRKGKSYGK